MASIACGHLFALSPDGMHLAAAMGNDIAIYDLSAGKWIHRLQGHERRITCLTFSPDGRRIASGTASRAELGRGDEIRIWDFATRQTLLALQGHSSGVNTLVFSADGNRLFSAGQDHVSARMEVRVWDATPANDAGQQP